ncbi:BON domain-containing protein [Hydrogenophaga sp.]|uniref:BON domain-containing protein n=1 Tax=Hydrogenophaga sp. TaxID=1904254 RepID=UPI0035653BBE
MRQSTLTRLAATLLTALSLGAGLSACAPLLVGGAMAGGAMVVTDRRTSGAQLEDQGIELRANNRLREKFGERGHIEVTSYNRQVLLTGEVGSEQDKALAQQIVAGVDNVTGIVNELGVMGVTTLSQRSNDVFITGRVKASMVDARDMFSNAFKVVTTRGTVYLMGRVTQREAERATSITRNISGVQRVVLTLEIISEDELARLQPKQ